MPRRSKGARLWLRPERRDAGGRITHHAAWVILDAGHQHGTGAGAGDREAAERALCDHIARKYAPTGQGGRDPHQVPIADALTVYLAEKVPGLARPAEATARIDTLIAFWCEPALVEAELAAAGSPRPYGATLADVRGDTCRAYARWRVARPRKAARPETTGRPAKPLTETAARRDLEDLRAAVNHYHREGYVAVPVPVTLPPRPLARVRWLTRAEAAALLRACWRAKDPLTGAPRRRHVARFILMGLYTGSRAGAICAAALAPATHTAWVDLERGIFHRRGRAERETKKRRPPVVLPARALAHIRRWKRKELAVGHVVEFAGKPVASVRKAFASAAADAGLGPDVTPHTLRHTAATWLMREGCDPWQAAGWLGMSVQTLLDNYGHHHPDHQAEAVAAIGRRPGTANVSQRNVNAPLEMSG